MFIIPYIMIISHSMNWLWLKIRIRCIVFEWLFSNRNYNSFLFNSFLYFVILLSKTCDRDRQDLAYCLEREVFGREWEYRSTVHPWETWDYYERSYNLTDLTWNISSEAIFKSGIVVMKFLYASNTYGYIHS